MVTLEQFKTYARVDHTDDDSLIIGIVAAAQTAVCDMTGKQPPTESDELYDIAVLQLAAHFYENRTPVSETSANEVPFTLQMLLSHIALSARYPAKE